MAGVYAGAVMLTAFYFLLFNKVPGECVDRAATAGATRTSLLTAICGNTDAASAHKWAVFSFPHAHLNLPVLWGGRGCAKAFTVITLFCAVILTVLAMVDKLLLIDRT